MVCEYQSARNGTSTAFFEPSARSQSFASDDLSSEHHEDCQAKIICPLRAARPHPVPETMSDSAARKPETAPHSVDSWLAIGRQPDAQAPFKHRGHEIFHVDTARGQTGGAPAASAVSPLLLIHGFPTSSYDWTYLWPRLIENGRRLIAPDMIGFGFSAKPAGYPYSIMDQADLHEALLRKLGVHEMHVLAHDYGDTVTQELLARHEERLRKFQAGQGPRPEFRFRSITFLNGGLFPETHRPRTIQKLLLSPIGWLIPKFMGEDSFRVKFSEVFGPQTQPTDQELRDFWRIIQIGNGIKNYHRLIRYMRERRKHRERWVNCLSETAVPLRLINGPHDPVSGRHMTERYREIVGARADVVLLGDLIGHYPQTEDPAGVLAALLPFLKAHDQLVNQSD